MKISGVYIDQGPQNFEIIQRNEENFADITMSGHWIFDTQGKEVRVYVRVLDENSGAEITGYVPCDMDGTSWSVTLRKIPAGGLYRIETGLSADMTPAARLDWNLRGEMRHFIGIGDVFVLAGQSNSAGNGKGYAEDASELGVHALKNSGQWDVASHPLGDWTDGKYPLCMDSATQGTSPYLSFGRMLHRQLHIPIGLVPVALGGSKLDRWDPAGDGSLYRNMLDYTSRLNAGYKAVMWYQGCSDGDSMIEAESYEKRFAGMVQTWRQDTQRPQLPFFVCQLNQCMTPGGSESDTCWSIIRDSQRKAAEKIPGCCTVPTTDLILSDGVHNSAGANVLLGERLARVVLSVLYGKHPLYLPADIYRIIPIGKKCIQLIFSHQSRQLESYSCGPEQLEALVEDEKGKNPVVRYSFTEAGNYLELKREIQGDCFVSCGTKRCIAGKIPLDTGTYMPILCFYRFPVK